MSKGREGSFLILILGLAAMAYGLMRGEAGQIMLKGVRICLECIGIG